MADFPLVVQDLSFRYRLRQEQVIHNISFSASRGELVLLAGSSGCGKTTLIRAINGLIPRSYKGEMSGHVLLNGQDTAGMPLSHISQMVGTVLQDPDRQVLGTKTISDVAFGLENIGLPREQIVERVDEVLARLNISHLRDRETFNLSGGEKQKVALAGVLAMRPSVLLLDEPLASLDPASALEALDMLRSLVDQGMTVMIIEHRVEDVLRIRPDRVMYITDGEIRYLGDADGLTGVVDYHDIKLPAKSVMVRAKQDPPPLELAILPGVTAGGEVLVKFEDVSFGYEPEIQILHDINLEIKRGDVIALLGQNGAGKSTLVKHAIGLLKPKSGRVLVNGKDTREASVAEIARMLGYVFQSPSHMLFETSVSRELAFGPRNLGYTPDEIDSQVHEALRIVNLADRADDPPLAMSFGQQKRVSIAAILAMRSKILVMDEPTAGQDYRNYMNFMDAILQLPSFEAILFITHDIDLALIYANRVILVADGTVRADGKPEEVLSDYDLLKACSLVPTSLLDENLVLLTHSHHFMRAEALAHV